MSAVTEVIGTLVAKHAVECLGLIPSIPGFDSLTFHGMHYQWMVLPFGISTTPWLFTRITKPVTQFLRQRGILFVAFIDDCLQSHANSAWRLLHHLGWFINASKSETAPPQSLHFIGALFNTQML